MLDDAAQPHFIDYQGGRRGAPQYDIASLLYDAKAAIPDSIRAQLLTHYLTELEQYRAVDRDWFVQLYRGYVLVRIMQAMGAYGYRGFFERKARFLQSVPYAARNLKAIVEQGLPIALPELQRTFERVARDWSDRPAPQASRGLTLHVVSFSFKQGYPEDRGGHGGGFVFDCRALPNPGRHLEYCELCGRDASVVEYLERSRDHSSSAIRSLVDNHRGVPAARLPTCHCLQLHRQQHHSVCSRSLTARAQCRRSQFSWCTAGHLQPRASTSGPSTGHRRSSPPCGRTSLHREQREANGYDLAAGSADWAQSPATSPRPSYGSAASPCSSTLPGA
jgi:hypothetical protein